MGFCFFANAAVAARRATVAHGLSRVMIVDWDVHHGNGTNDIFHQDSDVLFRALVARREAVHDLLVSSTTLSKELTALIRQSRDDLAPALAHLENVIAVLNKNEDNLDASLRLMAPFYRVFANTLGTGPWFDTWIANFPPVPQVG